MTQEFRVKIPLFIQNTLFGLGDLDVLGGGYNSDVILFSHSRQVIVKVIGGKKDIALTPESAFALGEQIARYRHLLDRSKVPVPGFLEWAVTQEDDGKVYLFLTEPYVGHSPERFLTPSDPNITRSVAEKVFSAAEPLLSARPFGRFLEVGLDPKTTNFVFGNDNNCTYVDFMPPRYRQQDGSYLLEYPPLQRLDQQELWKWKYFTPEGLLHIGLYQLGRFCVRHFQEIKQICRQWLTQRRLYHLLEHLEFLEHITPEVIYSTANPYHLRLMMCELASRTRLSEHRVEEFFQKTHFEGDLSAKMLGWAQEELVQLCPSQGYLAA